MDDYEYGGSQRLAGLAAVVTGASWGGGRAVALTFAKEGASVLCVDSTPDPPQGSTSPTPTTKKVLPTHEAILGVAQGERGAFYYADPHNKDQIAAAVSKCVELFGRLDIMVNNAAWAPKSEKPIAEESDADFDEIINVNLRSVWAGTKCAVKQMLEQDMGSKLSRGKIINITSVAGNVAIPNSPSFCASKAAVLGLSRQVALDYASKKINVNTICAGLSTLQDTNDAKAEASEPWPEKGNTTDLAMAAVFLASEESRFCTGTTITVDGGYSSK